MISIGILVLKNATVASISDCRFLFQMVNQFLVEKGKPSAFQIQLIGLQKEVGYNEGSIVIKTDKLIKDADNLQLIIVPVLTGAMMNSVYLNKDICTWLANQYKDGVEIAGLSTGVFMMAFSGILKGKQCTTHWHYTNELTHFYPSIEVVDERLITDQHGLYSSGGNNAYWNLLIHLVEKFAGREIAIYAAKYFLIDLDKNIQSPFIVFHGLKDHDDDTIKNVQEYIERHYKEKFTVDQWAQKFNMSRRTFERRFKKATRNTVAEYIQKVKMEGAKKQLEIGRKSVIEVMYDIGYSDIQTFRDVFKKITGMTPVEYKEKYKR